MDHGARALVGDECFKCIAGAGDRQNTEYCQQSRGLADWVWYRHSELLCHAVCCVIEEVGVFIECSLSDLFNGVSFNPGNYFNFDAQSRGLSSAPQAANFLFDEIM